ncbi:MAG: type II toxin-antitoxin system RelE/ParE family toxin [Bacteroidetes bacterium]|jgi:plasmid stabilization system protein ParE|nr:type II toxin-antitoxin system RelE/ParE family toxin [Bacteroidota bacterium]
MNVYLSQAAQDQLLQIIEYLEAHWSVKVRDNFIKKLDRSVAVIASMPYAYPVSSSFGGLRKCVITPRTTLYYQINKLKKEVEIVAVLDTRQSF